MTLPPSSRLPSNSRIMSLTLNYCNYVIDFIRSISPFGKERITVVSNCRICFWSYLPCGLGSNYTYHTTISALSTSTCVSWNTNYCSVNINMHYCNTCTKISNFNADNELEPFVTGRILFLWTGASVHAPGCLSSWTRRPATPAWRTVSVPSNP